MQKKQLLSPGICVISGAVAMEPNDTLIGRLLGQRTQWHRGFDRLVPLPVAAAVVSHKSLHRCVGLHREYVTEFRVAWCVQSSCFLVCIGHWRIAWFRLIQRKYPLSGANACGVHTVGCLSKLPRSCISGKTLRHFQRPQESTQL
jgi:hypothetical protein